MLIVDATRRKALKRRYLGRRYAKAMVHKNCPGLAADQLPERLIELSRYPGEPLR